MEALEHPSLVAALIRSLLGPLGSHVPDFLILAALVPLSILVLGIVIRSRLSIEDPIRFQVILEDLVSFLVSALESNLGPRSREFLPLLGAIFVFVWVCNMMGQIPGFGAPTTNINVAAGCAVTLWLYYHFHGIKAQGIVSYIKHFFLLPGLPLAGAIVASPIVFAIESISHVSRMLSLTLRLFGNIFGEHVVVLIIASLVPFLLPLPIQFLGLIVGTLQAFIFMTLGAIYLSLATAVDEHH